MKREIMCHYDTKKTKSEGRPENVSKTEYFDSLKNNNVSGGQFSNGAIQRLL